MEHEGEDNMIHQGGRLFQQYLADMWCKAEKEALNFIRYNQSQLRAELYQGLADAVHSEGNQQRIGTRLILPSSFHGSPRQMHELYQVMQHKANKKKWLSHHLLPNKLCCFFQRALNPILNAMRVGCLDILDQFCLAYFLKVLKGFEPTTSGLQELNC